MAKCNLGKVNLEAMLVSSFPNYAGGGVGGGPMPLAGVPHDLYTQLLACSFSQSVFAMDLFLACHFCAVFFPALPPSLLQVQVHVSIG